MTGTRREILEQVARGELSPEDADRLLRDVQSPEPRPAAPAASALRVVKLNAGFGAIVVEGDASVSEVEVEGKHSAKRDGDVLVVHGEQWTDSDIDGPGSFKIHVGRGGQRRRTKTIRFSDMHDFSNRQTNLRVRINPALALEAKLDAGSLSVSGVHAPIRARLAAGPITIEGSTAPLDISVNAGAIRVSGALTEGDSRIRSDAGAIRMELDPASSVRIVADAALGRVVLPGAQAETGRRFGSRREATIGGGDATLRVETAMGSINITTI